MSGEWGELSRRARHSTLPRSGSFDEPMGSVRARSDDVIYHIVSESEFRKQSRGGFYRSTSLAREGFVHCADRPVVLSVANDYFRNVEEPLLLLEIDPAAVSDNVVYESPAPIPGGGRAHLDLATRFPHVYGPIEISSIVAVGILKSADGYEWPERFEAPRAFLDAQQRTLDRRSRAQ